MPSSSCHRARFRRASVSMFCGRGLLPAAIGGAARGAAFGQVILRAVEFTSQVEAAVIEAWRRDYNENRPHSALEWSTPAEFARRSRLQAAAAMSEEPESSTSGRY